MESNGQFKDFVEFNKSRANEMLEVMKKDFDERVTDHYNMYTSLIKNLEGRDKTIAELSDHLRRAHIKIQSLEHTLKDLKNGC